MDEDFPALKEQDFDRIDVTIPVDRLMPHDTTPARLNQQENVVIAPVNEPSSLLEQGSASGCFWLHSLILSLLHRMDQVNCLRKVKANGKLKVVH